MTVAEARGIANALYDLYCRLDHELAAGPPQGLRQHLDPAVQHIAAAVTAMIHCEQDLRARERGTP